MKLDEFNASYPPKPPGRPPENDDELRKLDAREGVMTIRQPPVEVREADRHVPKRKGDRGCLLWVFDEHSIPYILERAPVADTLESGVVKHTNLTGGRAASCAGEFWADPTTENLIYVNGCSGRYGPRTREQLDCAVEVFEQLGYEVESFGWDEDTDRPEMILW